MNDLSPKKESSLFSDNSSEGRLIKDKTSKSNSPIAKTIISQEVEVALLIKKMIKIRYSSLRMAAVENA